MKHIRFLAGRRLSPARLAFAVAFGVILVAGGACSGGGKSSTTTSPATVASGTATTPRATATPSALDHALISASDLPPGWQPDAEHTPAEINICNRAPGVVPARHSQAAFAPVDTSSTALPGTAREGFTREHGIAEIVQSYSGTKAADYIQAVRAASTSCSQWTDTQAGSSVVWRVKPIMPSLAAPDFVAVHVTFGAGEANIVVMRQGSLIALVFDSSTAIGGLDLSQIEQAANAAYAKLQAAAPAAGG